MRPLHTVQRPTSARGRAPVKLGALCPRSGRERRLRSIGLWLLACALLLSPETQAQTPSASAARELSNAFRSVARQALPAVVFITVDKTATRRPLPFNN